MLYEELLIKLKIQTLERRREKLHGFRKKIFDPPNPQNPFPPQPTTKRLPCRVAVPVDKLQPVGCAHQQLTKSFIPSFVKMYKENQEVFFFASLINVTVPKKFASAMKILVKIKSYLSVYYLSPELRCRYRSFCSWKNIKFFCYFSSSYFCCCCFFYGRGPFGFFFSKVLVFRILQVLGSITGHYLS